MRQERVLRNFRPPLRDFEFHGYTGKRLYLGTFGKLLAPTLRPGCPDVPPELADAFSAASALVGRHPPSLEQTVPADFIEPGHLARHVRRVRVLYMTDGELKFYLTLD